MSGFARHWEQIQFQLDTEFNVRVGINTGMVMVGQVGNDLQMEYTAMGDAINIAARMEQTAQAGTVQISSDTYRRAMHAFEFEDLGQVEIKGKDKPVHTYRPLSRKLATSKSRGFAGMEIAMIGRELEWERLNTISQALNRGIGQIAFLVGEAGLGKSRLIEELKKTQEIDTQVDWFETAALSFETTKAYGIFQRLVRRVIGSKTEDSAALQRELIDKLVKELPERDRAGARKTFESLFGMPGKDGAPPLEGEAFKQALFQDFKLLWENQVSRRPIIIALDDLHWADPSSLELLEHLFPLTNDYPLMFICATRPERHSAIWKLNRHAEESFSHRYTEINVQPLSEEYSAKLVKNLFSDLDLSERLSQQILEKTEGNPFFVEEVVRNLRDPDANGQDILDADRLEQIERGEIDIPDNIQSLLTARIDRLQDDVRRTLQLAALIGRSFYYKVLEKITGDQPGGVLPEHLSVLQQVDLIREAARQPELEYSFKQALTQEAAYNTILLKQRRDFHRQVGDAIEVLFSDQLEIMSTTLAHHFEQAQAYKKAFHYRIQAGNEAYRLYAMPLAIDHYRTAIKYLSHTEADREAIKLLFSRLGRAHELNSDFEAALQVYERMDEFGKTYEDRSLELASLVARSTIYSNVSDQGDPERGWQLSQDALALARELQEEETEAKILWNHLNALRFTEKVNQAVTAGERALSLARKLELPYQRAIVANDLSLPLIAVGRSDRAAEVLKESRQLWRDLGNKAMLADSLATASMVHSFRGDFDPALSFSDESFQISNAINNSWGQSYSRFGTGNILWQRGAPARAIKMFDNVLKYGDKAHF